MNHFFLLQLSIVLFTVGKTATQNYTIERNFSNSHGDKFTIPKALCDTIKSNDKCKSFGAEMLPQTFCECQCPAFRPAFLNIGNDSRRCLDDEAFRKRQGKFVKKKKKNLIPDYKISILDFCVYSD